MDSVQEAHIAEEKNAGHKKSFYSIHTFEIRMPLSPDNQRRYELFLEKYCVHNEKRTNYRNRLYFSYFQYCQNYRYANNFTCYDNENLFRLGISDICMVKKNYLLYGTYICNVEYSITFRVNPRILLDFPDNKYIRIVPCDELENIMPALISVFKPYGFQQNDLERAFIKRLDICANINLGDQYLAEKYLKLLRKGGFYMGLRSRFMPVSPKSHRRMHPPNEVRFINRSADSYTLETLSVYLKHPQMLEHSARYDAGEIERAKGQIRFELRTCSRKNIYLRKKYGCDVPTDLISSAEIIGSDIFTKYLEGLYGKGKFVKYSRAVELIEKAENHHKATKDTMIQMVNQARNTDLSDAYGILPPEKIFWFRKYFNDLGISPITLRDSWKADFFENPVVYIRTRNVNE